MFGRGKANQRTRVRRKLSAKWLEIQSIHTPKLGKDQELEASVISGGESGRGEWGRGSTKGVEYEITYTWNLKKRYKWTYLQNRNRPTDIENKLMVTKGENEGRDKLGAWDWQVHTTIYKIDKQQRPAV